MAASFAREVAAGFAAAVAEEPDAAARLRKAAELASAAAWEAAAGAPLAPKLAAALRVHRSLPVAGTPAADDGGGDGGAGAPYGVVLYPSIAYGPGHRQKLDIYVPHALYQRRRRRRQRRCCAGGACCSGGGDGATCSGDGCGSSEGGCCSGSSSSSGHRQQQHQAGAAAATAAAGDEGGCCGDGGGSGADDDLAPVVFFVHGGIWATGDRSHFAPLATRLAQAGLVVVGEGWRAAGGGRLEWAIKRRCCCASPMLSTRTMGRQNTQTNRTRLQLNSNQI